MWYSIFIYVKNQIYEEEKTPTRISSTLITEVPWQCMNAAWAKTQQKTEKSNNLLQNLSYDVPRSQDFPVSHVWFGKSELPPSVLFFSARLCKSISCQLSVGQKLFVRKHGVLSTRSPFESSSACNCLSKSKKSWLDFKTRFSANNQSMEGGKVNFFLHLRQLSLWQIPECISA